MIDNNDVPCSDDDPAFYPTNESGDYCPFQDLLRNILALKSLFISAIETKTVSLSTLHILIEKLDDCSSEVISETNALSLSNKLLEGSLTDKQLKDIQLKTSKQPNS